MKLRMVSFYFRIRDPRTTKNLVWGILMKPFLDLSGVQQRFSYLLFRHCQDYTFERFHRFYRKWFKIIENVSDLKLVPEHNNHKCPV